MRPLTQTRCVPTRSPVPSQSDLRCPSVAPFCPVRAFTFARVASQVYATTRMTKFEEKAVLLRVISEYDPLVGRVRHAPYDLKTLPNFFLSNLYKGAGHLLLLGCFSRPFACRVCRFRAPRSLPVAQGRFLGSWAGRGGP